MSYTLRLTNGELLLTLPDQQSDRVSTSLTLIGKNVNAYGTDINQNYIHSLENFANTTAPRSPLVGQIWYDTNSQSLKVYAKDNDWKSIGTPIISSSEPITLGIGEFWYDTTSEQMKFKVDSSNIITVGPETNAIVGKSGWVNETIYNTSDNSQTVVSLYSNNVLMGVLSNQDSPIAVRSDYVESLSGLSTLKFGFNAVNNLSRQTVWWGTADNANHIIDDKSGRPLVASQFVRDEPGNIVTIDEAIEVNIKTGFTVGPNNDFRVTTGDSWNSVLLKSQGTNQNLRLEANPPSPYSLKGSALFVDGFYNRVGFFTDTPQSDVDVNGDMRVVGNLTVLGTSTFIDSQDLRVLNKDIWLGWDGSSTDPALTTSTDSLINGGGIFLLSSDGFGSKEIRFMTTASDVGVSYINTSWSVTGNLDLRFIDSAFYILDKKVLDYTSLGENIVSAPGLTQLGNLTSLNVGKITVSSSGTTATIGSNVPSTVIDIGSPISTGIVTEEVTFKNARKVTTVDPNITRGDYESQVATVRFVNDALTNYRNPTLSISIDVTGKAESKADPGMDDFVIEMLNFLWDPRDPDPVFAAPDGARARVLCVRYQTLNTTTNSSYMDPNVPLYVDKDGVQSAVPAMVWSEFYRVEVPLPAYNLKTERLVKEYRVEEDTWIPFPAGGLGNIVSSTSTVAWKLFGADSSWYWDNP